MPCQCVMLSSAALGTKQPPLIIHVRHSVAAHEHGHWYGHVTRPLSCETANDLHHIESLLLEKVHMAIPPIVLQFKAIPEKNLEGPLFGVRQLDVDRHGLVTAAGVQWHAPRVASHFSATLPILQSKLRPTRMWNMISSPATPTVCLEQKSDNFQSRNVTLSMPSQSKK